MKGQIIECLTLMAHAVGKEIFMEFAPILIETMIQIQESNLEQIDPQKSYLLSGWQRLCLTLGDDFVPYLDKILPSLFKLLENIFSEKPESEYVESTKKEDINTFETEEVEVALNMLSVLIDEMKENFSPYVEVATKLVLPLCNFTKNENIRTAASKCLPSLVSCVKNKEPQKVSQIVRLFLNVLWNSASSEFEAEVIVDQITAMKDCLDEVGYKFLTNEEIGEISQNLVKLLMESDKRKLENEKYKTEEEDIDEEEIEMLNEDTSSEEDLQVVIAELIGVLFKTHKEMTLPLVDLIYTQVLSKVLQPGLSDKMHKFGLFLIDDMIEFLGLELIPDKWPHLSEALIRFSNDKCCPVRQAAVYGIGVLAEKSREIFSQLAPQCINALYEALKVPQSEEKNKVYGHCKDNTISALGKIIKNHHDKINLTEVIQVWLNNLPLKFDKPEAKIQHEFLADILIGNGQLVLGNNGSNIPRIVKIMADVLDTKVCTPEIKKKFVIVLNNFKTTPLIMDHWNEVTAGLDEKLKKKIEDCMK